MKDRKDGEGRESELYKPFVYYHYQYPKARTLRVEILYRLTNSYLSSVLYTR